MIIDGEKFACEACIRGHRVTGCTHSDRALTKIAKKGRPVSQCAHCRANRKNRNEHGKCECQNKKKKKTDPKACRCDVGAPCLCSKKKTVKQEKVVQEKTSLATPPTTLSPVSETTTVDVLLQSPASMIGLNHMSSAATSSSLQVSMAPDAFLDSSQYGLQGPKRQKLTATRSESSLAFMGKHHKMHARNHGFHSASPYTIPNMMPAGIHTKSEQASPESQASTLPLETDFLAPVTALAMPNDSPTPVTTAGSFLAQTGQTDVMGIPLTSGSSTNLVGLPAISGMPPVRMAQSRYQPNLSINTTHSLNSFSFDNSVIYSAGIEQPQFSPGITTPGWDAMPPATPGIPATPNPLMPYGGQLSPVDFAPQRSFSTVGFPSTIPENSMLNDFGTSGVTAEPISSNSSDLADEPYGRSGASSMLDLNGSQTAQSYDSLANLWVQRNDDLTNSSSTLYQRFGALTTGVKYGGDYQYDDGMAGDGVDDDGLWMTSSMNVGISQAPMQMQDGTIQPAVVFQQNPTNPDGTTNF